MRKKVQVYAISGNHDSAVRFADHSRLIEHTGIHLSPTYEGSAARYEMNDEYCSVFIYLLPFIKPVSVRRFFEGGEADTYTDACAAAVSRMGVDTSARNVILAHQFVTGAERCESEEVSVGGLDNVDASVFAPFDYVALGHIHGPQHVGRETMRYCGTPLKYSFSEREHEKSVTVVDMGKKGDIEIRTRELKPLHDMRRIRGTYEELYDRRKYEGTETGDYIHAVLTDDDEIPDAMSKLRLIYPRILLLTYDNKRTAAEGRVEDIGYDEHKSPVTLFEEFYEVQNGSPMSPDQKKLVTDLIEEIWEGGRS
jgi:exonuclease SbcD